MNTVQILGNLARDPELRFTKTGRAVATFTVAATNTYIDSATNETKEQTAFINCVAWGKVRRGCWQLQERRKAIRKWPYSNSVIRYARWTETLRNRSSSRFCW